MSESDSSERLCTPLLMMTKVMLFLFSKPPFAEREGSEGRMRRRVTKKQNQKHFGFEYILGEWWVVLPKDEWKRGKLSANGLKIRVLFRLDTAKNCNAAIVLWLFTVSHPVALYLTPTSALLCFTLPHSTSHTALPLSAHWCQLLAN